MMTVNEIIFQVISFLKEGISIPVISKSVNIEEDDITSIIQSIKEKIDITQNCLPPLQKQNRTIDRITIHVANDCNLRCKYCYASGGNYNDKKGLMSMETARQFVNFCVEQFDKIESVVFFGGEPMLNVEIMKYICDLFQRNFKEGKMSYIPKFGIITNGTIINAEIISFVKSNISSMTISIDGPKEINDENRVYRNGKGSYDTIKNFIKTIQKETDISILYEATYTKQHIEKKYEIRDISKFMSNEFGIKGIIVEEESLEVNPILDYWKDVDYDLLVRENFKYMPDGFWGVLMAIINRRPRGFCPIVKGMFSVSSTGLIYPCHMITGSIKSILGTTRDQNIFKNKDLFKEKQFILDLRNNPKCKSCWGQFLCGGCVIRRFYSHERKQFNKEPNEEYCEITKLHLDQIILMIATLRKNPTYWEKLIQKAKEINL